MPELTVDPVGHIYRYAGRRVDGVTTVLQELESLEDQAALIRAIYPDWFRDEDIPFTSRRQFREKLEAAREFGTNVHAACHLWNINELDEESVDAPLIPYLDDWRRFLCETGFVVRLSETPVYHEKLGYAGTPDVEGDWIDTTWTVDIKSGVVPWTVGAQTAAYREARKPKPRRRLCVQLTGRGYKLHEQKDPSDFALFTSALNIHRAKAKRKPAHAVDYA